MNKLQFLRIPYAEDKVFGFLLLIYIICSFTIISVFSEPIDSPRFFIWSALLGLALLFWLRQTDKNIYLSKTSSIMMGALVFWSLLAIIFSQDWVNSLLGVNIRMTSSLWFFAAWAITVVLVSSLSKDKLFALLKVMSYVVGIISIWAICQYYGLGFYAGLNPDVRLLIPSFLGNPNFAAMFVAGGLFLNLWVLFTTKNWTRIIQVLFLACHVFALMIFTSRGSLLGVACGFAVVLIGLIIKKQWKPLLISAAVLLVLGSANLLFFNVIRNNTLVDLTADQSASQRWYAWQNAFTEIAHKPFFGSGLGNYFISYRHNQDSYLANLNWFDDPHNLFLHLAANGGLPLAIIFLTLFITAIWKLAKQYLSSTETDYFSLFIASAMVSWIVATLFNPVSVTNWLLASLLFAAALQTNNFYLLKNNTLKVGGYVLAAVLFLIGFSFILSEVFFFFFGRYSSDTQYYTSEYYANLAVDLNPTNLVALNQLAMTKYFNNDYDGSLQNLLRAERLHPLSAGVYQQSLTGYMNLYNKTNDEKFKAHVYEAAKKYESSYDNHQFVHQNLANLYFQLGDFDNALIQGRRWVVLSQGHYSSWLFMSQVYQAMGKPELQVKAREDAFLAAPSKELRVKK